MMRPYPATRRAAANAEAGQQGSSSSAAADPSSSLDDTVVMPSGGKKALNTGNSDAKWIMGDEDDQSSVSVRSGPAVQNDRGFYEDREGLPAKPAGSSGMSLREMHALSTAKWQAIAQMRADDISEDIESWREQGIYLNHDDYDDIDGLMGKLVTGLEAKERFKAAKKKGAKKGKQASKAQQQRRGIKQENRIGKGIQPTRYNQGMGGVYQPQAVPRAY